MNCPVCKTTTTLVPTELQSNLASRQCGQCGGHWIDGQRYLQWVQSVRPEAPSPPKW